VRREALRPVDVAREERDLRERFVLGAGRDRAAGLAEVFADWKPDLLVCDETDFGAMIAAEAAGLPFAPVVVIGAGGFLRPEVLAEPLDTVRAEHGLAPDPERIAWRRHGVLCPFPAALRDPSDPLPEDTCYYRSQVRRTDSPPPWRVQRPDASCIYLTLGTVFNTESGDLLARMTAALAELDAELVVTTGPAVDPEELGPQPDFVHVERFLPLDEVLPHCGMVVCHAGSGTVLAALAHGLPLLLVPLGADQPQMARRCVELGCGVSLDAMAAAASCAAAARRILEEAGPSDAGSPRARAAALRAEIEALPDPDRAVDFLVEVRARARASGAGSAPGSG
jgi:UDP:flavonoid glycosyltransferase YjiC (YdhE family)